MKEKIRELLRDSVIKYTKISIFDFDGTLVDSGTPETHKDIWLDVTGKEYPHKGWWGQKDSLNTEVFNFNVNQPVIDGYNTEKSVNGNLMVMLTGRLTKLSNEVETILNDNNLKFDLYLYNNGGSTLDNKIKQMDKLLNDYPDVEIISQYEDRIDHIPSFKSFGETHVSSGKLKEFNLFHFDGKSLKKI